ncbi:MAG: M48 family metalloprotease [Deltaproteobacteria bacterium]|nr:M48 family metalloprotease [Deltaproteobacteria bacterium]
MIELLEFTCGRCGAVNRLKFERVLQMQGNPKCGGCREPLLRLLAEPLNAIDPASYTHNLDREALEALGKIPGIKTMLKWLIKNSAEASTRLMHHASFIRVSDKQLPSLYKRFQTAGDRLGMKDLPELFVYQGEQPNASTFGVEQYHVSISTGALDLLDEEEQLAVLGHELGHVQANHVLYKTAARLFSTVASEIAAATLGIGRIIMLPLGAALSRWDRASELTGDRAALLTVRKPEVVLRTLMKVSGGSRTFMPELSIAAFIEQAENFEKLRDETGMSKLLVAYQEVFRSHPFPVYRAREVLDWVSTGAFLEILDGEYTRTDVARTTPCPQCGKPLALGAIICPHCTYGSDEDLKQAEKDAESLGDKLDKGFEDARGWFKRTFSGDEKKDDGDKDKGAQ